MSTHFHAKGSSAEIWLYDQIGSDFWGDGVSAKTFQKELTNLGKVTAINLHINSPGGDVFDGLAIYNLLAAHPARIVVDIDGLAASIASVIAMSGDEVRIAGNAMMMIHNPYGFAMGDAVEMRRTGALLDQIKTNLVDTYAKRTGQQQAQIDAWMDDETWLTAETAVQHGFADTVAAEQRVSASFGLLRAFKHVPDRIKASAAAAPRHASDVNAARLQLQAERLHRALAA